MKRIFLALLLSLGIGVANAQDSTFTLVEVMPQFPGGDDELMNFLVKNLRYPQAALDKKIEGTVLVTFVVTKKGEIKQIVVRRDIGGGTAEEVVRVVKQMPLWKPGLNDGKPVNVHFSLPVTFQLPNDEPKKRRNRKPQSIEVPMPDQ